jgi:hypothetical protein
MPRAFVLDVNDPAWDEWVLRAPHDIYHTAAYHRFAQEQGEGTALLAVYGTAHRFLAWPYLLRRIETHGAGSQFLNDITSVYGYSGPVASGCEISDDFVKSAITAIQDVWRCQNAVSAFARFHPLLETHRWLVETIAGDGVTGNGKTVSVNASISDEESFRTYTRILRQEITAARKVGLRTEVDETWSSADEFLRLYHQTMIRNRAPVSYRFSSEYISDLKQKLGSHAVLLNTKLEGRIVLSCIWLSYGSWMHAHLEGADENYLRYSPFKVMIDDVRRWAGERGYQALHLGGGRGGKEDSLFAFKARFSRLHHAFCTGRFILNQQAYDDLCEARRQEAAGLGMLFEPAGFFPAYRAVLVDSRSSPGAAARDHVTSGSADV